MTRPWPFTMPLTSSSAVEEVEEVEEVLAEVALAETVYAPTGSAAPSTAGAVRHPRIAVAKAVPTLVTGSSVRLTLSARMGAAAASTPMTAK